MLVEKYFDTKHIPFIVFPLEYSRATSSCFIAYKFEALCIRAGKF